MLSLLNPTIRAKTDWAFYFGKVMDTKKCIYCKKQFIRSAEFFYRNHSRTDGLANRCKSCDNRIRKKNHNTPVGKLLHKAAVKRFYNKTSNRKAKQTYDNNRYLKIRDTPAYIKSKHQTRLKCKRKFKPLTAIQKQIYKVRYNSSHSRLSTAIEAGILPKAKALMCLYCYKPAKHWHHVNGYDKNHTFDVVPVCYSCHGKTWRKHL